ncbi:MAG: hypothetical protein EXQ87_10225 [Alphaproteobacteria bacterium]|nr:hypothetical protein [Alphaproteobacteria bacterium]
MASWGISTAIMVMIAMSLQFSPGYVPVLAMGGAFASISLLASSLFLIALTLRPAGPRLEALGDHERTLGLSLAGLLGFFAVSLAAAASH